MAVRTRRDTVSHSIYTVTRTALGTAARDRKNYHQHQEKPEQTNFFLCSISLAEVTDYMDYTIAT